MPGPAGRTAAPPRSGPRPRTVTEDRPDLALHFLDRKIADDGQGAVARDEIGGVELLDPFRRRGRDVRLGPVNRPAVRVSREQGPCDERGGALPGVVRDHPDLFQDDLLLLGKLAGIDIEVEEDLLLVGEAEVGPVGRQGDLEGGQVEARVGVEIGAVPADVASDLGPAPPLGAAEEDAVFEDVDETVRPGGLVLDADVHGRGDVDEGKAPFLEEDDPEAVHERERLASGRGRGGGSGEGQAGYKDDQGPPERSFPFVHAHLSMQQTCRVPAPLGPRPSSRGPVPSTFTRGVPNLTSSAPERQEPISIPAPV